MARAKIQTVAGHRLPEPRVTSIAVWLVFLWIGVPILVVGGLLDVIAQTVFGVCTGLWCYAVR